MKNIENLWPKDLGNSNISMPKEMLMQQANFLAEMTKNILVGEIKTIQGVLEDTGEKVMVHEFVIKAPSMGNYQFSLMRIMHNFNIYPIRVFNALNDEKIDVKNEEEFIKALANILNSTQTKNAISSMIAQSL